MFCDYTSYSDMTKNVIMSGRLGHLSKLYGSNMLSVRWLNRNIF